MTHTGLVIVTISFTLMYKGWEDRDIVITWHKWFSSKKVTSNFVLKAK
jgi:hypothetical protein